MPNDVYLQPDAPDPVLSAAVVLTLVRRHVPRATRVTAVDESGGEARTYVVDDTLILKTQRPHRLRPRTSLAKEVFFLNRLASEPGITVPRVLGYGREGRTIEYICMTHISGVAMANVQTTGPARQVALGELGRTLRRIHALPREPFAASGLFPGDPGPAELHTRLTELFGDVITRLGADPPAWTLPLPAEVVAERALAALPASDLRVALHSNPGPPHTFVDPATGAYTGLIDFGDAYISHPALDLWRWPNPADRSALFQGYTAEQPVDAAWLQTWRVVQVLADLVAVASTPALGPAALVDIQQHLQIWSGG